MNHAWYGLFIDLVFVDNQFYKLPNCFVRFQWVSQLLIHLNYITIAPPYFFNTDDSSRDELGQNSLHRTLSDSNLMGHLPHSWLWCLCQADKNMCVIAEKSPGFSFVVDSVHISYKDIIIATVLTRQ
ncbi:MAG: hypothetical protein WBN41_09055 [Lysobacterales bacterium]